MNASEKSSKEPGIAIYQHDTTKEFLFVVSGFDGSHDVESFRRLFEKMKSADVKQRGDAHLQHKKGEK